MATYAINLETFTSDVHPIITDIITRMGWSYDLYDYYLVVNLPLDDEPLFNFIFDTYL